MKVSICMITYNQEKFIAQAVESVLMQRLSFGYELVIGEDCSQDKTREIVTAYARRHPDQIRVLLSEKNLGAVQNFMRTYSACRGQYVAILDGDDFWTSPYKLQKQVNFLDARPEYSGCFHAVTMIPEESGMWRVHPPGKKKIYTIEDYIEGCIIAAPCSTMFRNRLIGNLPYWFDNISWSDWPWQLFHAERGPVGYIDEVMAVYRIHPRGVFSKYLRDEELRVRAAISIQQLLMSYFAPRYRELFSRHLYRLYYLLAHSLCDRGDLSEAQRYVKKCLRERGYDLRVAATEPLKIYLHMYVSPFYSILRSAKRASERRINQAKGLVSTN